MMMRASLPTVVVVAAALGIGGANCGTRGVQTEGCASDGDCPDLFGCDAESGLCLCIGDNACDATEFCNTVGRCQLRSGCASNNDCKTADRPLDICDTTTGECVTLSASTQCVLDSHCPFGSVCQDKLCQPGCRENGDCPLGDPCINGSCDATPGACNEDSYCEYGELCNVSSLRCSPHVAQDQLCDWCTGLQITNCATECLYDPSVPPQSCSIDAHCAAWEGAGCFTACLEDSDCIAGTCEGAMPSFGIPGECSGGGYCYRGFCGAEGCSEANPCPKGYECYTLIIASGTPCTVGGSQCSGGRACLAGGENSVSGHCSCLNDGDCGGGGATCTNPGPDGICITGSTCGPQSGLVCEDLR